MIARRLPRRSIGRVAAALAAPFLAVAPAVPCRATAIAFHEQSLELPGAPAALVSADLDGDGRRDLAVVVVYTEWDQIGIEERTTMDEVEGLVEVLTIVPVLLDRREVRAYLGRPGGGFEAAGEPLPLPLSVLSLEPGPPGIPALALTDAGASALVFEREAGGLALRPVVEEEPVLAGTGAFLAGLGLVRDVTGDGVADLLLPAADGLAVYLGTGSGLEAAPAARVALPEAAHDDRGRVMEYPLPRVEDLDGDGLPDLLFRGRRGGAFFALRNLAGEGGVLRFGAPVRLGGGEAPAGGDGGEAGSGVVAGVGGGEPAAARGGEAAAGRPPQLAAVLRLAPSGPAAGVRLESLDEEDAGLRQEMRQVREPRYRLHLHPLGPELALAAVPRGHFEVTGYVAEAEGDGDGEGFRLPGGFQDLDGDGRLDLVTVTNDVSLRKALALLATRRLSLDLGFLPWCQGADGSFRRAPGPPLTSRLRIDLGDLEVRQRSLFAGDFDGDGRVDFLQLGRARQIGIHRGRAGCSYPERPDAVVRLRDELRDLALVEARDLDGDGRADLAVTHPRPADEAPLAPAVRLDLYLSGGGR